jgi:hypothetical protein
MTVMVAAGVRAQDSTVAARHVLPLDVAKVQPYRRAFDIIVTTRDSAIVIGQREIALTAAEYSGAPAWLIVETRTGLVPSAESLYVAPDMRPLHWSAALGAARLGAEFVGDSIYGATSGPGGRRNLVLQGGGRPDLLVSTPMIEAILPLLPLTASWVDSAAVLSVDLASSAVIPVELTVIGEEDYVVDSATVRSTWVIAVRAGERNVLYWVTKDSAEVLRMQQPLPAHVGQLLEYRIKPGPPATPPAPLPPPPPRVR